MDLRYTPRNGGRWLLENVVSAGECREGLVGIFWSVKLEDKLTIPRQTRTTTRSSRWCGLQVEECTSDYPRGESGLSNFLSLR